MDKYKHACPACGQRIEYTIDYCGRQISCPSCHALVVFPVAPIHSATQKLRLQRDVVVEKKKSLLAAAVLKALIEFPHWKVVGACAVPFFLVGGLLLGATYLRKTNTEEPAKLPTAVTEPVGSDAWKKMTDLGQLDQAVQFRVRAVALAKAGLAQAERARQNLHNTYHGQTLDGPIYQGVMRQYEAADRLINQRQQELTAAQQAFETAYAQYQKLGGRTDYRSQLP